MIICPACGAPNADDATTCATCLAVLSEGEAEDSPAPDDTAQMPAVTSEWSGTILRQATELLLAGKSREVAGLCHEVIDREPQNVAAYELLGMAEEENGNPHLALQAYEQVVVLEPERNSEKEKIRALREQLAAEQPESLEDEEMRRIRSLNRWATVVLAASLALLLLAVAAMFVIKSRNVRLAQEHKEQVFAAAITRGERLLAEGRFDRAMLAFREAYNIKKGNSQARQLYAKAYQGRLAALDRENRSMGGKVSLEPRLNPFAPIQIGPKPTDASAAGARGGAPRRVVPLPPREREGDLPNPLPEGEQDPLAFLEDKTTQPAEDSEITAEATAPLPPVDQGTPEQPLINIWAAEPPVTSTAGPSAAKLRAEAYALRTQGKYEQAIPKYEAAKEQFSEEIQRDPSTAAAKQTAIESIEKAIEICKQHSGG